MKHIKLIVILFLIGYSSIFSQDKKFITYKVKDGETVQSISKSLAITPYDLLKLNPDIKDNVAGGEIIIVPNKAYDPLLDINNADLSGIGDKDIIVDKYIYHEVAPKETIYSIVKSFNISSDELNQNNPFLASDGLKIGQVIKIPLTINEAQVENIDKNTQPYLVKPKETKYSIAKKFGLTIEYLEKLNPKIAQNGLQIGDVIVVPMEIVASGNEDFIIYEVQKLETMYSLTHKFSVSAAELEVLNPELFNGVREGMLIKIPNKTKENKIEFVDLIPEGKRLNIAMMLPFKSNRDSLDFENDRLLKITSDFYLGALMAIDSLKKQGLSVRLKVYDTENDKKISDRISKEIQLQEFDAVVGPMFLNNVKAVSNNLKYGKPLIISPISTKDHSNISNKKLVQERASLEHHTNEMMEFIKSNYEDQDLIVIKNESERSEVQFNRIINDIRALNPEKEVQVLEPKDGYIKPEVFKVFRDTLDRDIVNWFFLTDNDPAYLGDVFNNLGVFPEQDSLMLFSFEKDRNYNRIDNNFLARVNFHYPSNSFVDQEAVSYQNFENSFRRKYYDLPSEYAVEGFDLTYDLLMRLATSSDIIEQGVSERISTKYEFIENTSGSIVNKGIFIIKYDGLELKTVNSTKP
jgi:LysM repeat protein